MTDLEQLLDGIPALAGQERHVTPLPGGLTNTNYRVRTATLDVVVRVSPPGTELLAIDREHEHQNTCAAAEAGVGAPVVDYLRGQGVLVVGFLPGRTYGNEDVGANLTRVAAALRRLHEGPSFAGRFDMVEIQRGYLRIVQERGFRLPEGYLELAPYAAQVTSALALDPEALVPCHNDLLAANFLDAGPGGPGADGIHIIDYEYSGMNEPSFELGNVIQEAGLGPEALAALCRAYYGPNHPLLAARTARAELWGAYAAYGWTLWGMIQDGTSAIDEDFVSWGMAKFDCARAQLDSPRLAELIAVVQEGARR